LTAGLDRKKTKISLSVCSNVVVNCYKEQENVSTDSAEKRLQQTQDVRGVYWERFALAVSRRKYRIHRVLFSSLCYGNERRRLWWVERLIMNYSSGLSETALRVSSLRII